MNSQHYSTNYALFHGAFDYDFLDEIIIFPINDVSWTKSIVLKLKNFINIYDDSKPLAKSLMFHYKMETNCTIFTTKDSWSLLLGDQKLVYPQEEGKTLLCGTQLFCKEPKSFELYMKSIKAISFYENIYFYKNAVIYLDNFDIPYPGGNYFSVNNIGNEWYRICFVVYDKKIIKKLEQELKFCKNIYFIPFKQKPAEAKISNFINLKPITEVKFSETYYESTNIVLKRKCFQNPNFIIQDILNSISIHHELGIIIEYPILISYLVTDNNISNKPRQFLAFAINCNAPKTILYVPYPFDRFYEYKQSPKNVIWTTLLYDKNIPPLNMDAVILDKNIIGYTYKNTFFCLTHPKLLIGSHMDNKNTSSLLNMLSFDLKQDENFKIVYSYRYDVNHTLYLAKHNKLKNELWCLSLENNFQAYPKKYNPSYLVRNWVEFLLEHVNNKNINYGDLNLVKLMFILARHKICFITRESRKRDIIYENYKDIVFKVEKSVLDFINSVRLELIMPNRDDEDNNEGCIIL